MNKKKQLTKNLYISIPILLVVGLIVWSVAQPKPGEFVASQGNQHIESVDSAHMEYSTTPPTSGPHVGSKANWGIHSEQIADELQIHNLEDGGVIVHYLPGTDYETIDRLKTIVSGYSTSVILEPYEPMDTMIALTAWGRIDRMDELDEERIKTFIDTFKGIDHHR